MSIGMMLISVELLMMLLILLFVPGDSDRKLQKAVTVPADALICDLEDAVAPAQLPAARERVRDFLLQRRDRFALYGGTRFGGTLDAEGARDQVATYLDWTIIR